MAKRPPTKIKRELRPTLRVGKKRKNLPAPVNNEIDPFTTDVSVVNAQPDFDAMRQTSGESSTIHFRQWLYHFLNEGSATFFNKKKSALAVVGDRTEYTASDMGMRFYKKAQPYIKKWLDEQGLSEIRIKKKLLDLLEAKKTQFFSFEGKVTDQRDVAALDIQIRALEMALKMAGLAREQVDLNINEKRELSVSFDAGKLSDAALDELLHATKQDEGEIIDCDWSVIAEGANK